MFGLKAEQLYDQRFGRALDELHPFLGQAWVAIAARVVQQEGVDLSVLHWDTTTIHLEGEYEDSELAAYGRSSDNRFDNKLVKVGMDVTSRERLPLLYRLLNGATGDTTTPVPNLEAISAFLRRPECATLAVRPSGGGRLQDDHAGGRSGCPSAPSVLPRSLGSQHDRAGRAAQCKRG